MGPTLRVFEINEEKLRSNIDKLNGQTLSSSRIRTLNSRFLKYYKLRVAVL